MRQSLLTGLLLLLLVVAAVALWLVLGEDEAPRIQSDLKAANEAVSDRPELEGLEPGDSVRSKSGTQTPDAAGASRDPETTGNNVPRSDRVEASGGTVIDDADEEGNWKIHGRVEFSKDFPVDALTLIDAEDVIELYIQFLPADYNPEDPEVEEIWAEVGDDLAFESVVDMWTLGLDEDRPRPEGRWQVMYSYYADEFPSFYDIADGVALQDIPNQVEAKVGDGVVDLGTVVISPEQLLGEQRLVTGRLVHTSGVPLSFSGWHHLEIADDASEPDYGYAGAEFTTNGDGRFFCPLEMDDELESSNLLLCDWQLLLSEDAWDETETRPIKLESPRLAGSVIDFGDIRVAGSLLEITAKIEGLQLDLTPDGNIRRGIWGDFDCECVNFELQSGELWYEAQVFPHPRVTRMLLPPGRYLYAGNVWDSDNHYDQPRGAINIFPDKVTRLELEFEKLKSIDLKLEPDEGQPEDAKVYWTIYHEDQRVAEGYSTYPCLLPVKKECVTRLNVVAEGYKRARAEATHELDILVVPLKRQVKGCTLEVTLPARDDRLPNVGGLRLFIEVGQPHLNEWIYLQNKPLTKTYHLDQVGEIQVWLGGGAAYGYPGGIICGPIEVTAKQGETLQVDLTEFEAAPWGKKASNLYATVKCDTNLVVVDGRLAASWDNRPRQFRFGSGYLSTTDWFPTTILDGDQSIPIKISPPTESDENAQVSIEFEKRVQVRVNQRGEPVGRFKAVLESVASPQARCDAQSVGGVASLWLPPGECTLTIWKNGVRLHNQKVTVRRGDVAYVEVNVERVSVQFECPSRQSSKRPDNGIVFVEEPSWVVYRMTQQGDVWIAYIQGDEVLLLEPGRYRVVPEIDSSEYAVEFDISDGKDTTVKLPALPELEYVDLVLKFDVSILGINWAEPDLEWYPADADYETRMSAEFQYSGNWIETKPVPEGMLLMQVPLNREIVIAGPLWVETDTDEKIYALKPLKVKVTEDGQSVACTWLECSQMGEGWHELEMGCLSFVEGCSVPFRVYDFMPVGRHEVAFYKEGELVLREWVTIEQSDEFFDVPPTLRTLLVSHGLLEPED